MPAHRRTRSRVATLLAPSRAATAPTLLFTARACLNITTGPYGWPENYCGYQPWHRLLHAADPDMPTLPLTFTIAAPDPQAAAHRAADVGQRRSVDQNTDYWPLRLRRLAVGDVVIITPRTPTTGERRYWALAPGGHLTELPCISEPLPFPPPLQLPPAARAC